MIKLEADIPIEALSSKAPIYDRKWKKTKKQNKKRDLIKTINLQF